LDLFLKECCCGEILKFIIEKLIGGEGARLLENENYIFFVRCNAVEAFLVLRDWLAGETLISETFECGSPPAPRKASTWNGKQQLSQNNNVYENSLFYIY
jgi:hypothetical protein